ncbi:ThuA domain-containing protein [Qipengyuania sp.]|uniref:ThuA domain-containing protein n=1 Tax=Qipengyuania sp. TaxID=2004515 RepID=UPI0035C80842
MTRMTMVFASAAVLLSPVIALTAQPPGDPHLPAPSFDTVPPELPDGLDHAVLVFSKTNGWRHIEHIPHSNAVIQKLAGMQSRETFATENAAIFNPAQLARFDVIVMNSASGDLFTSEQRAALVEWLEGGGGLVAMHAAGGDRVQPWTFYAEEIIGARFIGHPNDADQFQTARTVNLAPDHPVMQGIPAVWPWGEEFYSFDRVPTGRGTRLLLALDESEWRHPPELAMGDPHPLVWTRTLGKGRIVFSALGHRPEYYDATAHRRLIGNMIAWAAHRPRGE